MAKQEKLEFDYEGYFNGILEDTAILMWSTHHAAYTFAFYLNRLYNLNLERKENVTFKRKSGDISCPIYCRKDTVKRHTYILIDNSGVQPETKKSITFFDKTLLIMGDEAHNIARRIHDETGAADESGSIIEDPYRDEMLKTFVNSGILESALFDFSNPDAPYTTYFPDTPGNETLQKKRQKFLKEQREFIIDLIIAIDSLLPDYESISE